MPALISHKSARLAAECTAAAELSSPCQAGQKWHCVREAGRWRKHKCKYQPLIQSQLDNMQRTISQRKCACFTPAGLVYRRIAEPVSRFKRDIGADNENHVDKYLLNFPHVLDLHPRSKRDTFDHVTSIMKGIQEEIFDLETSDEKLDNSTSLSREAKCNVASNGTVNCTDLIYEDPKAWKDSRLKIEKQIRKLREQLLELKEIRRHLKLKKPQWVLEHEVISEETDDFDEADSENTGESFYENKFIHKKDKSYKIDNLEINRKGKHKHKHERIGGRENFYPNSNYPATVFENMTIDTKNLQISSTTEESFTFPSSTSKKPLVQITKVVNSSTTEKFNTTLKVESRTNTTSTDFHQFDKTGRSRTTTKSPMIESVSKNKLGPARIDVSTFSNRPNGNLTNGRLGPLNFADNEDKHVCYCDTDK